MDRWVLFLLLGVSLVLLAFVSTHAAKAEADQFGPYKAAGSALLPGESLVYYDYIEDGRLKGGVVTTVLPPPAKGLPLESPLWEVQTIIDNGPSVNRIDLVFTGDGWTFAWTDLSAGQFALTARAVDDLGAAATSPEVLIRLFNP